MVSSSLQKKDQLCQVTAVWVSKCLQSSATEKLCDYSQGFVGEWGVGGIGVFLNKGVSNSQQAILLDENSGGKEENCWEE